MDWDYVWVIVGNMPAYKQKKNLALPICQLSSKFMTDNSEHVCLLSFYLKV